MFFKIKAGTTGRSIPIKVQDSSSPTGALLSGLTASTSGLTCKYRRQGQATEQSVPLTASGVTLDTFTSGGFIADPILAGHYELQIPNAALQTGATYVVITLSGAANMVPLGILIELDAVDYQVDAFGALKPTASGRTLDVTANGNAGIDLANVDNPTATLALTNTTISVSQQVASVSGNVVGSVGSVSGNVGGNVVGSVGSVAGNVSGNVNGSVGSVVGNVGGNVVGNVGSISGVTFPANFGNLGISVTGELNGVLYVEELGTDALTANDAVGSIASTVWGYNAGRTLTSFSFQVIVGGYGSGFAPPTVSQIADGVLMENVHDHRGIANSLAWYIDKIRKANYVTEGTVAAGLTPTTKVFRTNLTGVNDAYNHQTLLFISGVLTGESKPIEDYSQSNGLVTLEEDTTVAPGIGDEFVILPQHVHTILGIADGVLGRATSTSNYDSGDVGYVLRQLFSMIESDGSTGWELTSSSLVNAPSGGGAGGTTNISVEDRSITVL